MKKVKKKTSSWYRKKCVELAKIKAKERDLWQCQYCGRSKEQGYAIHGSHILPEGVYTSLSADPENIIPLCATHHLSGANPRMGKTEPSWHSHPLLFATWFEEKWPGRKQKLYEKARENIVVDWEKRLKELKEL